MVGSKSMNVMTYSVSLWGWKRDMDEHRLAYIEVGARTRTRTRDNGNHDHESMQVTNFGQFLIPLIENRFVDDGVILQDENASFKEKNSLK